MKGEGFLKVEDTRIGLCIYEKDPEEKEREERMAGGKSLRQIGSQSTGGEISLIKEEKHFHHTRKAQRRVCGHRAVGV